MKKQTPTKEQALAELDKLAIQLCKQLTKALKDDTADIGRIKQMVQTLKDLKGVFGAEGDSQDLGLLEDLMKELISL